MGVFSSPAGARSMREPRDRPSTVGSATKKKRGDWICQVCEYENLQRHEKCRNPQCRTRAKDFTEADLPVDLQSLFLDSNEPGKLKCVVCEKKYRSNDVWRMRTHWYFSQPVIGRQNRFYC